MKTVPTIHAQTACTTSLIANNFCIVTYYFIIMVAAFMILELKVTTMYTSYGRIEQASLLRVHKCTQVS